MLREIRFLDQPTGSLEGSPDTHLPALVELTGPHDRAVGPVPLPCAVSRAVEQEALQLDAATRVIPTSGTGLDRLTTPASIPLRRRCRSDTYTAMRGFRTGTSGRHSLRRLDVIIDTEGLAKRYGQTDALVDLTMRVEPGEVFGFLGPNGAGKTTAVKLLLGLARPTGGHGTVLDAPLGDRATRARIGYLPELFRYQPWLRAREVLELHARLIGSGMGRSARAIDDILVDVGLLDRATDLVGGFSKGMQQRLGLGVALLGAPALVVLDEPTQRSIRSAAPTSDRSSAGRATPVRPSSSTPIC